MDNERFSQEMFAKINFDFECLKRIHKAKSIKEISDILTEWEESEHQINLAIQKGLGREVECIRAYEQRPKALSHLLNTTNQ